MLEVGVDPRGHVVLAAMVMAPELLSVNLLNVDRVSVIVAAAVMFIVPELCVKVVLEPLCVQLPARVHVPEVAVSVAELPNVTAVVEIAEDDPAKIGEPVFRVKVVDVKLPPAQLTVPVVWL
jgi:hypothetical protein